MKSPKRSAGQATNPSATNPAIPPAAVEPVTARTKTDTTAAAPNARVEAGM
jgi:hypothetical protein